MREYGAFRWLPWIMNRKTACGTLLIFRKPDGLRKRVATSKAYKGTSQPIWRDGNITERPWLKVKAPMGSLDIAMIAASPRHLHFFVITRHQLQSILQPDLIEV